MKTKVLYNDDSTVLAALLPGRAKETLIKYIDIIADNVPVDIYAIECATPDMCIYETKVGEVIGRRFKDPPMALCRGIEALKEEGRDHLSVYIERLHSKNIKCMAEIRMGDTHHRGISADEPLSSVFSIEHPEWVIKRPDGKEEVALDYSFPEVRSHRLAIMTELATGYDIDGLELNFNRWAKHFERDKGREKAPIMTDFVGRIHEILQRAAMQRKRDKLLLGVRLPGSIEECWLAGCDPRTWVLNGWIDYIIAAEYNSSWPGTRVEEFNIFCRNKSELYVQMGDTIGGVWRGKPKISGRGFAQSGASAESYAGMLLTDEEARADAHNFYTWGADGIAFWNISCNIARRAPEQHKRIFQWMNQAIDPEKVKQGKRIYRYLPLYKGIQQYENNYAYRENLRSPVGGFKGQVLMFSRNNIGKRKTFWFRMADGRNGEKLNGLLRFRMFYSSGKENIDVDINNNPIDEGKISKIPDRDNLDLQGIWFEIRLGDCPPFCGDNELGLTWKSDIGKNIPYMEELEVTVE